MSELPSPAQTAKKKHAPGPNSKKRTRPRPNSKKRTRPRPNSKKKNTPPAQTAKKEHAPSPNSKNVNTPTRPNSKNKNTLGRGGGVFFLLFGRGRVFFFFAVWAGPGPPPKQQKKRHPKSPNNIKDQTTKEQTLLPLGPPIMAPHIGAVQKRIIVTSTLNESIFVMPLFSALSSGGRVDFLFLGREALFELSPARAP